MRNKEADDCPCAEETLTANGTVVDDFSSSPRSVVSAVLKHVRSFLSSVSTSLPCPCSKASFKLKGVDTNRV